MTSEIDGLSISDDTQLQIVVKYSTVFIQLPSDYKISNMLVFFILFY